MKKYKVYIFEHPFIKKVRANSAEEAEIIAVNNLNGGQWDYIYKCEVKRLKNVK